MALLLYGAGLRLLECVRSPADRIGLDPPPHARYPYRATPVCLFHPVPPPDATQQRTTWAILEEKEAIPAMLRRPPSLGPPPYTDHDQVIK
jgi:hypothetical protein